MEDQPLNSGHEKPPSYATATASNWSDAGTWTPPPGYYPNTDTMYQTNYVPPQVASTTVIMPEIILIGTCPACRVGMLEDDYTCLGLLCAIFFFPLGIICCLLLKNRRCSNCGAYFG